MEKSAIMAGLGSSSIIKIKTDEHGRMIPSELEAAIEAVKEAGEIPLFVNGTVGTTVQAAIDPIDQLADICEKHDVWLHLDGCLSGSYIMCPSYDDRLSGRDRADSFAWDPHKMLEVPLQSSFFLTRH